MKIPDTTKYKVLVYEMNMSSGENELIDTIVKDTLKEAEQEIAKFYSVWSNESYKKGTLNRWASIVEVKQNVLVE